ncbi:calponin homology domain-containing protein DDB_G0272472-like isoform X25 [Narcine bancroftii]|uniref:calponin homology domain-containing protein DDB_G0272472-like isoform X25 n=1 Tax=Narcine bancroftii TaxID=1343680 RepID=UPI0038315ADE
MVGDSENPAPPQDSAPTSPTGGILDDVQILDLSTDLPCDQNYTQRVQEFFTELGIAVSPSAATLPPESELHKRIYNYRINEAKDWMPEQKYKELENKFDLYRHELVLLAQQEQRSKHRPDMTAAEKRVVDAPMNRRLASDLQRLMEKKLDLVLQWLPSMMRKNLDFDTNILRNQIIRENELAKTATSSSTQEMTNEERALEERIMGHKLQVAEAWMPKDLLEKLNNKFLVFRITAAREEREQAAEDIRSGMSADERRIQAMIRQQQLTLRVQQAYLNKLQIAESWIPEEQRLKIENEYSIMRARLWRQRAHKPMPGAWDIKQSVQWDTERRRKPKRLSPLQRNPMVKIWKKNVSRNVKGSRPVIQVMTSDTPSTCPLGEEQRWEDLLLKQEQHRLEEIEEEQEFLAHEEKEFLRRRNEMLLAELGISGPITMEQSAEDERLAREEQEFLELEKMVAEQFEREFLQLEEQRLLRNRRINEEAERLRASQSLPQAEAASQPRPQAEAAAEASMPTAGGAASASCSETTLEEKQQALRELQEQLERLKNGEFSEEEKERLLREESLLKAATQPGPSTRYQSSLSGSTFPAATRQQPRPSTLPGPSRRYQSSLSGSTFPAATRQQPRPSTPPGPSTRYQSSLSGSTFPAATRQQPRPSTLPGPSRRYQSSLSGSTFPAATRQQPRPSTPPGPSTRYQSSLSGSTFPAATRQQPRPSTLPGPSTRYQSSLSGSTFPAATRQQPRPSAPPGPSRRYQSSLSGSTFPAATRQQPRPSPAVPGAPARYKSTLTIRTGPVPAQQQPRSASRTPRQPAASKPCKMPLRKRP